MDNSEPIFKSLFKQQWDTLPPVFKLRYANRPFSSDIVIVKGNLNVYISKVLHLFLPLTRMLKVFLPYPGENVPVTVKLCSQSDLPGVYFDRLFYFPGKTPYRFRSYMKIIKEDNVIELIRFGVCWHMKYYYDGKKILLEHRGYMLKVFGKLIPLPISFLLGNINAEEESVSENSYRLLASVTHPLFGKIFEYSGVVKVIGDE